jgi:pimeloyl-ACP methyl ester carboxylesterase
MGAPWRIPRRLRHPIGPGHQRGRAGAVGPAQTWLGAEGADRAAHRPARHATGIMRPEAQPEVLVPMLREFLVQDWRWYMHLAVAAAEHEQMDLSFVTCPVTLVAGRHDVLTSMTDVLAAAEQIPHAEVTVLPGSHFLPMEFPELVSAALDQLAQRCDLEPPTG